MVFLPRGVQWMLIGVMGASVSIPKPSWGLTMTTKSVAGGNKRKLVNVLLLDGTEFSAYVDVSAVAAVWVIIAGIYIVDLPVCCDLLYCCHWLIVEHVRFPRKFPRMVLPSWPNKQNFLNSCSVMTDLMRFFQNSQVCSFTSFWILFGISGQGQVSGSFQSGHWSPVPAGNRVFWAGF